MPNDTAFFTFSTEEDISYVLEFSGIVLTSRTFSVAIKDRASNTTRATLTIGAGLTVTGTNVISAAVAKATAAAWPTGEYSADLVDTTGGANGRIMAVRFVRDVPGRLVQGVRDRKAFVTWGPNKAYVTATGAIGPAGPVGPVGEQGIQGVQGVQGIAGEIVAVTAETLAAGEDATVSNEGTEEQAELHFGIPRGDQGDKGWSPEFAVVIDAGRRVLQVVDWAGGEGTEPASGDYVGATGLVSDIADAVNIRGDQGPTGSVVDGDKGDITVADGGTSWTIDDGAVDEDALADEAVTLAKMADLTAPAIIGRTTTGAGVPEALTPAQARSVTGQKWVDVYDSAVSGASVTAIPIPLTGGFSQYRIRANIIPAGVDFSAIFRISTDNGATYRSGASDYSRWGSVDGGGVVTALAATSNTFGYFGWTMDTAAPHVGASVTAVFRQGTGTTVCIMEADGSSYDGANLCGSYLRSVLASGGAATHIAILVSAVGGLFAAGTRIIVEGC
jgi:hypothetical protein